MRAFALEDTAFIASLLNLAAEGMLLHIWRDYGGPGCDPWEIGCKFIEEEAGISHKNIGVAELAGDPVGCLICYALPDEPAPPDPDVPTLLQPLAELRTRAVSTGYISAVSVPEGFQGRGFGSYMLTFADSYAGKNGMSIIVSNANNGARRLYERHGYQVTDSLPMVKNGWKDSGTEWLLLIKPPT